ncbi:hypothetical protein [Bacillus sp. FSL K6-3431]|uniref:hypothetical protein n=1 Tax=Bacillus sp. FSL K6-3431 TaxID=2921500 RepID=UPI0030F979BE
MAKRLNSLLVLGLGVVGAKYLSKQENRAKAMDVYLSVKEKIMGLWCEQNPSACEDLLEKAGNPDPYDLGDANMVSEGAMYSVDYYNKEEQQQ